MIVVTADSAEEVELARRILAAAEWKLGRTVPHHVEAIGGQRLAELLALLHAEAMTDHQAATILGCSTRTVRRRVADGTLQRTGRRITTRSVLDLGGTA